MGRKPWPLLKGPPPTSERDLFLPGEPRSFDEFIGQEQVMSTLRTAVEAARKSGRRLPHILLADQRHGLGKTLTAKITAAEMEVSIRETMGNLSAFQAVQLMQGMDDRDILFWDEIHTAKSLDWLLPFMQSGYVILPTGSIPVPDISLIAATTKPESLDVALLSRFVLRPAFQDYTIADMERILSGSVSDPDVRKAIITVSGGNPRELKRVEVIARDLVETGSVTVAKVLANAGYGKSGLPISVETYLSALWTSPSFTASKSTMATLVGPEYETAEAVVLDRGLVSVTGRGRRLTKSGIDMASILAEGS